MSDFGTARTPRDVLMSAIEQLKNQQYEILRLRKLLREARETRAADIASDGWADRVDRELANG